VGFESYWEREWRRVERSGSEWILIAFLLLFCFCCCCWISSWKASSACLNPFFFKYVSTNFTTASSSIIAPLLLLQVRIKHCKILLCVLRNEPPLSLVLLLGRSFADFSLSGLADLGWRLGLWSINDGAQQDLSFGPRFVL